MSQARILYCHCAYAKIIPERVKNEVLERLAASGVAFEAVADLCELSARRDPSLKRLVAQSDADTSAGDTSDANTVDEIKIAACFPRSVKWLFNAADAALPETGVEICNMRQASADEIVHALLGDAAASASPSASMSSIESSPTSEEPPAPSAKSSA